MPRISWPPIPARAVSRRPAIWLQLFLLTLWVIAAHGMTDEAVAQLRQDTRDLFYHGYSNYMSHAFPEDELRPISCQPQTRNRQNVADIGLNDVLGNYSLTLIDSLSTLAILASGPEAKGDKRRPLRDFQDGVKSLVDLYGDGSDEKPCGTRACAFDLDSKVQVFETNIRGVGGLLSAHLFAIGELPIYGYTPVWKSGKSGGIKWKNGLVYNGQLLRLAHDLATRLLPAFSTPTDIPYPRVNLRYGIPFYRDAEDGMCRLDGTSTDVREITENCAAGAGSLVLEFSTLSRLVNDTQYERLAKRAFWAIWNRRSSIGLLGNGIDAESGQWTSPPLSGIGAGIDSFFEYSLKTHILLSNLPYNTSLHERDDPDSFLQVWEQAHSAVKHHVLRGGKTEKHPYYGQVDVITGAPRYAWIDNLSAYYPGLLVLAGELDEAIESHLLFSALWTKYSALPERWHVVNAFVDSNFRHWVGRPEFIESTFHLYQATKDPFYLHVGEMTLRDIRRRCWTKCGWADLRDVTTGEQRDRMESFFLGETAKYLYLLFSEDHPLNKLDRPVVFTTEGHPLIIPDAVRSAPSTKDSEAKIRGIERRKQGPRAVCPAPPSLLPLSVSSVVGREDLFHAAALAQLHTVPTNPSRASPLMQSSSSGPGISYADVRSPTNYTFFPWTLPQDLIPAKGTSSPILSAVTSILTFPNFGSANFPEAESGMIPLGALQKIDVGVRINSLSNMRLNMVQRPKILSPFLHGESSFHDVTVGEEYQIHGIANWPLGRDEKVVLSAEAMKGVSPNDPHFTRVKDLEMLDLVLDVPVRSEKAQSLSGTSEKLETTDEVMKELEELEEQLEDTIDQMDSVFSSLLSYTGLSDVASAITTRPISAGRRGPSVDDPAFKSLPQPALQRHYIPAILPTGVGAAPLPPSTDTEFSAAAAAGTLRFRSIFFLADPLCTHRLPVEVAKKYNILIIIRGGCSFNEKLANIPSFVPAEEALQLVIVVSIPEGVYTVDLKPIETSDATGRGDLDDGGGLIRPLLDEPQLTPNGVTRRHPIAMVMVDGTRTAVETLRTSAKMVMKFDEGGELIAVEKDDEQERSPVSGGIGKGLGVKRRYWFESMGVPIANLVVL